MPFPPFWASQGIYRRHVVCVEHTLVEHLKGLLLKMFHPIVTMWWCEKRKHIAWPIQISRDVFLCVECFWFWISGRTSLWYWRLNWSWWRWHASHSSKSHTGSLSPPLVHNICWGEIWVLFLNPPCLVLVGFSSNCFHLPFAKWRNLQHMHCNGLGSLWNPSALQILEVGIH